MLSIVLVPAILAILACSAHSSFILAKAKVLDRTLGALDSTTKACLDGLDLCRADYENVDSTTGMGAYDECVKKLQNEHGPACKRPMDGNLDGALYDYGYTEVDSLRRCRELCNLHHRPPGKICVAWSYGILKDQSTPTCQLHATKGEPVHEANEYMQYGERIEQSPRHQSG